MSTAPLPMPDFPSSPCEGFLHSCGGPVLRGTVLARGSHPAIWLCQCPAASQGGAEQGKEPGCQHGSGQVKTTPTLRCAVNICPYPQATSIFVPSHTVADSEEGSGGGLG